MSVFILATFKIYSKIDISTSEMMGWINDRLSSPMQIIDELALVTSMFIVERRPHRFRKWLGAWPHQAITWTNIDLCLMSSYINSSESNFTENILDTLIPKITCSKLSYPGLPGVTGVKGLCDKTCNGEGIAISISDFWFWYSFFSFQSCICWNSNGAWMRRVLWCHQTVRVSTT